MNHHRFSPLLSYRFNPAIIPATVITITASAALCGGNAGIPVAGFQNNPRNLAGIVGKIHHPVFIFKIMSMHKIRV
ncbi:MAG TPA: hypothetical protein DCG73_12545 [Morganella sp. (in: Bacteria)]|nr:hypothetical protein [Morganella sp. (in: enterobacteria)]